MEFHLTNIPLFSGIEESEFDKLLSSVVFQRRNYPSESMVVSQGEECNRLLVLTEGAVKGEMISPTGKSLKIEDMESPTVLAPAFVFGKNNRFPVTIISTSAVKFVVIPRAELLKLFQLNKTVLQNFLAMISSRAQFLSEKLRFHSFKSLKAKLAFFLVNEAGDQDSFRLKHSQNELAELFGVARPSVGRAFLLMQEEGIIDIRYKQVKILNREKLTDACGE